ncbi:MAGUK p55 subfamily member 5 [Orussus abietinus]|uniref:MAGUK p55 subfamily member 5 n=1 Tax=Orussus abietinus TaxID=222816 RepID=UPI000626422A|nr:MAGUK p55 subfamily member 5 [Orussus abietinus]
MDKEKKLGGHEGSGEETKEFAKDLGKISPLEKEDVGRDPEPSQDEQDSGQRESSVDAEEDYPFAKEDYPTMLKTCSDDSASARSSSGRSDSTAPLDTSLVLRVQPSGIVVAKHSPLYDSRRIDLGSPCRSILPEIKIAPLFGRGRDSTSFDNPAYGLADFQDLQGLLVRSDEVSDLTRLIDEQGLMARKAREQSQNASWSKDNRVRGESAKARKSVSKRQDPRIRPKRDLDSEELIGIGSTDNLVDVDATGLTSKPRSRKKKQASSGYSTLRSDASTDLELLESCRSSNRIFREVAVDCPPDFVPVTKSHPVYPPPNRTPGGKSNTLDSAVCRGKNVPEKRLATGSLCPRNERAVPLSCLNDRKILETKTDSGSGMSPRGSARHSVIPRNLERTADKTGLNGVKPAIPPRDQKRAPARPPKDNLRLSTQNNNVEQTDNANAEITQQQLHSIRKYQEKLRKRKDEEERQEYLNQSLRGSRKLQALESHATSLAGQENPAYSQDETTNLPRSQITPSRVVQEVEEPPRSLTYGEVVATLERLQLQLRNISGALGISGPGVEAELEAVRTLLVQRRFATALATHHAVKSRLRSGKVIKHHAEDASSLARDCVEVLEQWQSSSVGSGTGAGGETIAAVEELTGLLTSVEMEGLLLAHDSIVSYVDGLQRKSSSSSSPSGPPSPSSSLRGSHVADNIKVIRIEKTNEPLGATVRNEGDAVIIGRVVRGGAADKSGLLHEGDEVLEVNGVEMRGKSVNEVCDILAGMQGSLTFLVLPAPTSHRNNYSNNRREDTTQIHHVRAHFDYDPEEDPYIPCRELGVSFQKGDVLHVISQEDPNWWQAYREGEEDQTLAGLIPSRAFQHQRESMKQTIAGDKSTVRGSKKSSTLLCARKNPKKKKKNKFGLNFNDDGYPLYATTAIDDYDSEEVLTYEEVALYYPRANHKRPIVLIGPPNIGRHELRQRLMQDSERFAAAIPHTSRPRKDSEVDGQDYHFISRSQFESDILCRKFVEHGEYEKAYYGTSVEAIRSVVNSGKICVLNLHPQSLKILRSSDLKPYVVFVAPPSLEKLRQKRLKNNESFKEEELKDIIEKAREMEDKYGHLFDMIIINNDTDRAYNQLLAEINSLEREPQWVPACWVQ